MSFFPKLKTVTYIIVLHLLRKFVSTWYDLQETALQNPDLELFVDGLAFRNHRTGCSYVLYAVVTQHEIMKLEPLPVHLSVNAGELIVLTEAWKLAQGKTVTVFQSSTWSCHIMET